MRKTCPTPQGGPTEIVAEMPDCAGRNGAPAHCKHTPGPWYAGCEGVYVYLPDIYATNGIVTIAKCSKENARLIAAAPDLLEALRGFVECDEPSREHYDAARAAIARATGVAP